MKKIIMAVTVLAGLTGGLYAQSAVEQLKKDTPASTAAAITASAPSANVKATDASTGQTKPVCYELSKNGVLSSLTAEMLCVEKKEKTGNTRPVNVVLGLDEMGRFRKVAEFDLELLRQERCMDCNKDVYGISNPSNTLFNKFMIKFEGKVLPGGSESGTVSIGTIVFKYRSISR